jgi:hypothetical protein
LSNYSNYSNYHCAAAMSGAWVKNGGWFKKEERDGKPFARCTFMEEDGSVCPKEMAVHQYNMWEHLQNVHRFTKDDAQRRLAAASKGGMRTFTVALKRPPLSKDQESEYETLLAVALANQGMPLSCFDKRTPKHMAVIEPSGESVYEDIERFTLHNWLLHVFPEFHGVSRNTMMKRLEGEAMQLNMDVRFIIKSMIGVGLTTDGYSGDQKLKYHSLTCHGLVRLASKLYFVNFVLSSDAFPEGDADTVGKWLVGKCAEWGIAVGPYQPGCQLVGASVDGAERKSLECAAIPLVWCYAHALDLAISDVTIATEAAVQPEYLYSPVPELITRARAAVTTYFAYPKRLAALNELAQTEFDEKQRFVFPRMVETRWNSGFDMLTPIFERKALLKRYWQINAIPGLLPADFDCIEDVLGVLSFFKEMTVRLQASSFPTSTEFWPFFFQGLRFLRFVCTDNVLKTFLGRQLRDNLFKRLCDRFRDIMWDQRSTTLVLLSIGLSPWFWQTKAEGSATVWAFDSFYDQMGLAAHLQRPGHPALSGTEFRKLVENEIIRTAERVVPNKKGLCAGGAFACSAPAAPEAPPAAAAEPLYKRMGSILRSSVVATAIKTPDFAHATVAEELAAFKVYVSELPGCKDLPLIGVCGRTIMEQKFPRITHLALWHMALPATNAPSESLWSDVGNLADGNRNRISDEHLSVELSVKRNYDLVKHLRAQIGCKPAESLEQAQKRWEESNEK